MSRIYSKALIGSSNSDSKRVGNGEFLQAWGDARSSAIFFLWLNGQRGFRKATQQQTFGADDSEAADKGVWMSIWVEDVDVDVVYRRLLEPGIEVTWLLTNRK